MMFGSAAESPLPQAVAEDHDVLRARAGPLPPKSAPLCRFDAEHFKQTGGDARAAKPLRLVPRPTRL